MATLRTLRLSGPQTGWGSAASFRVITISGFEDPGCGRDTGPGSASTSRAEIATIPPGTAEAYADIRGDLKRVGRAVPANEVWIAALARQHSLPVLSRDHHFDFVAEIRRIAF